jgi:ubiquinone/menaquinone biosynthesis C-methylase UbiE
MFHPQGPTFWELTRQALSSTARGYDLLSPKFDVTPFRTPKIILDAVHRELQPLGPFRDLLDVCCGTGAGMESLSDLVTSRIVGIDFSRGMLTQAEENLRPNSSGRSAAIEFVLGDVLKMEFDSEFDLAVCFGANGHLLPNEEHEFCRRLFGALRPGGRLVLVTTTRPGVLSAAYWLSRSFNAAMWLRNWVVKPPFIMYYLTFLWPDVGQVLEPTGFQVQCRPLFPDHPRLQSIRLIIARKPTTDGTS